MVELYGTIKYARIVKYIFKLDILFEIYIISYVIIDNTII